MAAQAFDERVRRIDRADHDRRETHRELRVREIDRRRAPATAGPKSRTSLTTPMTTPPALAATLPHPRTQRELMTDGGSPGQMRLAAVSLISTTGAVRPVDRSRRDGARGRSGSPSP